MDFRPNLLKRIIKPLPEAVYTSSLRAHGGTPMTLKRIATQTLVTTASLIVALIVLVLLLKALQLIDDSVTATAYFGKDDTPS